MGLLLGITGTFLSRIRHHGSWWEPGNLPIPLPYWAIYTGPLYPSMPHSKCWGWSIKALFGPGYCSGHLLQCQPTCCLASQPWMWHMQLSRLCPGFWQTLRMFLTRSDKPIAAGNIQCSGVAPGRRCLEISIEKDPGDILPNLSCRRLDHRLLHMYSSHLNGASMDKTVVTYCPFHGGCDCQTWGTTVHMEANVQRHPNRHYGTERLKY